MAASKQGSHHERDDGDIHSKKTRTMPGQFMSKTNQFERDIDGTTQRCEQFCPRSLEVETIRFDEPNQRVQRGACRKQAQPGIAKLSRSIQKYLRVLRRRIEVGVLNERSNYFVHVLVNDGEKSGGCSQHNNPLGSFEEGNESNCFVGGHD